MAESRNLPRNQSRHRLRRGARLWTVATATFKAETYRYLRIERPSEPGAPSPAGTIHLPDWADSEWLKQLVAEQLVTIRNKRGYARAAAWILGADRFDARMWQSLEKQAGVETASVAAKSETDTPSEPQAGQMTTPRRRGWRVSTPKYME